ncbi:MAG: serine protease [Candidatus Zixiibacteriota bacterium]|jgi:hypothetical protein
MTDKEIEWIVKIENAVVALGSYDSEYNTIWEATGFLVGYPSGGDFNKPGKSYQGFLVTCKHVFKGKKEIVVLFNAKDTGKRQELVLKLLTEAGDKEVWHKHDNAEIDVAVLPIFGPTLYEAGVDFSAIHVDELTYTMGGAESDSVNPGDYVYMLGFTTDTVGHKRKTVIYKSGIVSTLPEDVEGAPPFFFVDIPVFPGGSGSAIITNPGLNWVSNTRKSTINKVIGLASRAVTYEEVARSDQGEKKARVVFIENQGLTYVYPSKYIIEIIEQGFFKKNRRTINPSS